MSASTLSGVKGLLVAIAVGSSRRTPVTDASVRGRFIVAVWRLGVQHGVKAA